MQELRPLFSPRIQGVLGQIDVAIENAARPQRATDPKDTDPA